MDEKLQEIFKIRPLQTNCIAFRNSTNEYRKMVKSAAVSELKNLLNIEVKMETTTLQIPDENQVPNFSENIKIPTADRLLQEVSLVEEGLKLL